MHLFIAYLIDKVGITYGQAIQVVETLGRMINTAATRAVKDIG